MAFAAYRNGRRIGEHRLTFEQAGADLTVRIRAEMAVAIGPVTLYRYLHEVEERWRAGRFESLASRTNSGGKRERVSASRTASGVVIRVGEARTVAAQDTIPLTHWNTEVQRAPLFNPQTGKLLRLAVRPRSLEPVALADGRTVTARRVSFTGDAQIDNWYDEAGVWTALRGRLDDGSTMEYRRL
ncbi:DUF6134 family protein [Phenylobacterium sp. J367]|uniref:DUF6134 family protein n=1 Tax=Phenylobacterium sp. J367 TaxID=2898435 RepID=UPI0027E24327|nr:DUF6134 family protein [Phenylobacterium sp. J367]MCR5878902.1 DUF6134 family protein [Phenylobacterium sp. J367]